MLAERPTKTRDCRDFGWKLLNFLRLCVYKWLNALAPGETSEGQGTVSVVGASVGVMAVSIQNGPLC